MSLNIVTTRSASMYTCKPNHTQSLTINSANLVNIGIQTNNYQSGFLIEQFFISNNGQTAFIQVFNSNTFKNIGWWAWTTQASDSATAPAPPIFDEPQEALRTE